jgi:hypothetical protein
MNFKALPCPTRWEGVIVGAWIVLIDALMFAWANLRPVDWLKFALMIGILASLPLLGYVAYRTWSAFSLEYWVDRNAVTISWANVRQTIPMDRIQRVIRGGLADLGAPAWYHWPGPHIRPARGLGVLNLSLMATRPLADCLVLDTGDALYAISPARQEEFLAALQERYRLGPVAPVQQGLVRTSYWRKLFGNDQAGALLIALGLVGVLALLGVLMVNYPDLPDVLVFHYNSEGIPDVVRSKAALFLLPAVGFLAWVVNGFWGLWMSVRRQRIGAYMLWGGTLIVQVFSMLALQSLIQ